MAASSGSNFVSIEKLKGIENYSSWKFMMRMILVHEELWDYVESDDGKDNKKALKALAKIALNVQPTAIPHIRNAKTAHEAWTNLQKAYEDRGLCRRLGLLRTLFATKLSDSENMEAYLNRITEMAQQLSEIGSPLEDDFIAVIMLSGLTADYDPLIMAMENSNLKLSSEIVKGKLLQENIRRDDKTESALAVVARKRPPSCFKCRKTGHFIKDCPKNVNKKNPKTNTDNSKALLTALSANISSTSWYIDSGATGHMCHDRSVMSDFVSDKTLEVKVANGDKLLTAGQGTVRVQMKNGNVKTISNVYFVPNLTANLLSVSEMVRKGFKVVFSSSICQIYDGEVVVASATLCDGVYQLDIVESTPIRCSLVEKSTETKSGVTSSSDVTNTTEKALVTQQCSMASQEVWHRRLGHLNHRSMQLLNKGMATGITYSNNSNFEKCVACVMGKQTRLPFPKKSFNRATDILELVHTDLCGPMPCSSFSGSRYILTFIDDFSRKTFVYFLRRKDEVFNKFKEWKCLVEKQTDKKLKAIRSDNGGEYINLIFQNYLKANGISHQTTIPFSPQQNGIAERANRSILEKARCMLQDAGLEKRYWAEAVNTAVYLKNRSPTIAVKGCTPEEKWTNKKVSLSNLRIFGCIAYSQKHNRTKLDPKAEKLIFVGYCEESKGYRLINPDNPTACIKARDVTFFENKFMNVSNDDKLLNQSIIELSPLTEEEQRISTITLNDSESDDESFTSNAAADESYVPDEEEESTSSSTQTDEDDDSMLSALHIAGMNGVASEPLTVKEALSGPEAENWRQAMENEYKSFITNNCWTVTDRLEGQRPIKCKWVFKKKYGVNGELLKYKARLVAKGYTQQRGIDYEETFSPVVRYSSLRTLLAIAVQYNMDIDHLDVKTAFLNGDLKEVVYMEQPEGFVLSGKENKIYRLNKAIYGLKQASKAWYEKINKVLCETCKLMKSTSEPCVYYKRIQSEFIIIALYVDDIILFSTPNSQERTLVKEKLKKEFEITDLGPASHILGMRLTKTQSSITLDQINYIERVLQKYKMEDSKPTSTPMETGIKLTKAEKLTDNSKYDYRGLIGSLMYIAVGTRPDISHAVSYLSQYNNCFTEVHWKSAKRILRYLKGTKDLRLTFGKGDLTITAYADADWGRSDDRRSYTGYLFKVGNSIVSWESRKQRTVALSSTEAEYMCLSDSCKEALFLCKFLEELFQKPFKVTIFNDNQSAQKLCMNSMFHARTKHIDIRHHFIREHVSKGSIDVKYLCTKEMLADILTKPLSSGSHVKFVTELNLV